MSVEAVTAASPLAVLEPWLASRLLPLALEPAAGERITADVDVAGSPLAGAGAPLIPAAVLLGLTEREGAIYVIFTRRADTLSRHSGQVALPGGRAERGETPWAAAIREAEEEIGLDPALVRPIGLGDRHRTFTGFDITPVVAVVTPGFTLNPSEAEVAEVFATPFAFLIDPSTHEERIWESPSGPRRYYAMPHEDRLIWGATAGILRSLWERLFREGAALADEAGRAP